MHEIVSEIEIDASPQRVWSVLTDFASYPQWSAFIREVSGSATRGARLRVVLQPPGGHAMTFRPTVLTADPARELRWLGRLGLPRVFDGEHSLELRPLPGERTQFVQSEEFRGLLVPLLARTLGRTQQGFESFNAALKKRVEELEGAPAA